MVDDYYDILGVSPTATAEEIKKRFRFLSRAYHPADKSATEAEKSEAEKDFKRVQDAHENLSHPVKRAQYDASRRALRNESEHAARTHETLRSAHDHEKTKSPSRPQGHKTALAIIGFATFLTCIVVFERSSSQKSYVSTQANSNGATDIRTQRKSEQMATIKSPNPGESVEFDLPVYPDEWSVPVRIPDGYHLVAELQGQNGLRIWCATDDNRNNGVLLRKGIPNTLNASWELWSWSFLGIYNPLAKRPAYADGPKARSAQYKSAENFVETLRVRLEPGRTMAKAQQTLDSITPTPTQPQIAQTDRSENAPAIIPPPSIISPPVSSEPYATFVGERYPDTRTRIFSPEELQSWSTDQLRYAINEVFARHGASFPQSIANQFRQFTWYRERPGITFDEIERSALSDIERQNLKVFSSVRNQKGTSVPVTKLFAGRWNGIIRMYLIPPAGPQQVFDDRYTFEIADDESSIRYTDEHSNPSPPWPLLRNGRNGFWQDFGRAADGSVSGQGVGNFIVAQNGTVAKVTINSVASNGVRITQVGTVRRTK